MRFQLLRLPSLLLLPILAVGIVHVNAVELQANTVGNPAAAPLNGNTANVLHIVKKRKKSKKSKKQKRSSTRRSASRRYTLRGNPEVTRKVATTLIAEQLPDLAQLIGLEPIVAATATPATIDASVTTQSLSASDAAADVPTAGSPRSTPTPQIVRTSSIPSTGISAAAPSNPDYSDSELSEEEDPDKLSAEDDEILEEDDVLTIDEFYDEFTDYMASLNGDADMYVTDNGIDKVLAMETLMEWLGTRYLFGGTSSSGIDCSAFTRTMYGSLGCPLPRTAAMQWEVGDEVSYEELQFGDLIFFHTRTGVYVSHVGMYLGNNMFAHASSRNGVTVSSLESNYYSTHFIGARRYDVAAAKARATMELEADADNNPGSEAIAGRIQSLDTTRVR